MRIKLFLAFLFVCIFTKSTIATEQYSDILIYKGKEYLLQTNPLEKYFENHPDKRPDELHSTALWRGYVAIFEIKDNQLFLKDIEVQTWKDSTNVNAGLSWKSVMTEVFPVDSLIKLDWVTGFLIAPYGGQLANVKDIYESVFEKYILFEIDKGNVNKTKKFSYKQFESFKDKQFLIFKETEEYKRIVLEEAEDGKADIFFDNYLRYYITKYTTKILTGK